MDFSEGCKKIVDKRDFNNFDKFPYYYLADNSVDIGIQGAFNAEDTAKIDKEVEDFFTKSFGAFLNTSDDGIIIKQKPKESDVQKFAKNLGDILLMTREGANSTYTISRYLNEEIDSYESQLDKFTKNAPIVSEKEYRKAKNEYYKNDSEDNLYGNHPRKTMLARVKYSKFDPSSIAKFIAKDIANLKKYVSLLSKIHINCIKVYNYDINLAKMKMFSDQIRRVESESFDLPGNGVPDKLETGKFN